MLSIPILLLFLVSTAGAMDLTLDEFGKMALKTSLRIQTARANLDSSRYSRDAVLKAQILPSLTANLDASKSSNDDGLGTKTETRLAQGGLSLSQPLPTGTDLSLDADWIISETLQSGSITSANRDKPIVNATLSQPLYLFIQNPRLRTRRRQQYIWENARDQFRDDILDITFDAQELYYNALLQKASVAVERKKFKSAQTVYRTTRELVRAGKLAKVELGRADIRLNRDRRRIQTAESEEKQSLNDLKDFVLLTATVTVRLTSELQYAPFKIPLKQLLKTADQKNPPLLISRRSLELSRISLEQTREGRRPAIDLTGTYSFERDRSVPGAGVEPNSWSAAVGLSWPFFDADQTRLQIRQSEISLANAERSLETQRRNVELSVRNTFVDLKRNENQIKNFEKQRKIGRNNIEAVQLQYSNGLARLIDVFDAENELRDLELEYLNLLVTFNRLRDNLSRDVGIDVRKLKP